MRDDLDPTRPADDRLRERLEGLRSDIDLLLLPGAPTIRARGHARARRRRIAAVTAAGVLTVLTVLGGISLGSPRATPPATRPTGTPVTSRATTSIPTATPRPTPPSSPTSLSPLPSATAGAGAALPLPYPAGAIDLALFLPGASWAGADLDEGAPTGFGGPFEPEGTADMFECDPDRSLTGTVGMVPVADLRSGRPVGLQKIRVLDSAAAATDIFARIAKNLNACTPPAGANYVVRTIPDPSGEAQGIGNAAGGLRTLTARLDVTTKDTQETLTTWVGVILDPGDAIVSTVVIHEPPATTTGWSAVRRITTSAAVLLAKTGAP